MAASGLGQGLRQQADFVQNVLNENRARDAAGALSAKMAQAWNDYSQKSGQAAVQGLPDYVAQIQSLRDDAVKNMPNLETQAMLGQQAAYMVDRWTLNGGAHSGQQARLWTQQSNLGNIENAANQAVIARQDPDEVMRLAGTAADSAKNLAALDGLGPDDPATASRVADAVAKVAGPAILTRSADGDALGAQTMFARFASQMSAPAVTAISAHLRAVTADQTVASSINAALTPGGAPASPIDRLGQAIKAMEGPGTSVQGAVEGLMPKTFKQYAWPGENIGNSSDREAVRARIINDLWQKFNGDPARVAVGFFSGPRNVAPPNSMTPWVKDIADKNGTGMLTSQYVAGVLGRMSAAPAATIPAATARDQSVEPRYFDEIGMITRLYQQAANKDPVTANRIIAGGMEQISRMNAFENQAEDRASRDLAHHQTDNAAVLFGAAASGQPIADQDLAGWVRTQQITPSSYNAIRAVQDKVAEGRDDPMTVARLWDGIGAGAVTADDVFNGITAGVIKGTTGDEMIKGINARAKTQQSATERGDYETLKTALGGHALESGVMDIFGEGKVAQAQLWTQAQSEWTRRVVQKQEPPDQVLADMLPRYQKSIPSLPAAWPNPRFGAVQSVQDVAAVTAKTKAALADGSINLDTYNAEGDLLLRYLTYFKTQDTQKAAAAQAAAATKRGGWLGGSGTPPPLAPPEGR